MFLCVKERPSCAWISGFRYTTHSFLCSSLTPQCDVCASSFVKWYAIKDGSTPLLEAAKQGHVNVVEYLVTEAKANPNQPDQVLSVIHHVCDRGVCVCLG